VLRRLGFVAEKKFEIGALGLALLGWGEVPLALPCWKRGVIFVRVNQVLVRLWALSVVLSDRMSVLRKVGGSSNRQKCSGATVVC